MKFLFKILAIVVVSVILIVILKPYVDDYKEKRNYDFILDTHDGKISKDDFKGKVIALYFG